MSIQPKGDFEVHYGGPWAGLDFSKPYTNIEPNSLAPGSVNTQTINGFLCSSPWIASSPYSTAFAANEFVVGIFAGKSLTQFVADDRALIVTNIAVYEAQLAGRTETTSPFVPIPLTLIHTWGAGEFSNAAFSIGECCSFIEVNGTTFIAGIFLNGIFSWSGSAFLQATAYVSCRYIAESGGRLIAAECRFPGGGGTGVNVLPTIAWSAVGAFTQWDPLVNPQAGFNLLSDVPDQITGLASIGRSALIFRTEGLSQMDPNAGSSSSGLQPFVFYHLWASSQGVGAFQGSVAQYGQSCFFRSDDNVYMISISGGLQSLGDKIIPLIAGDFRRVGSLLTENWASQPNTGSWYFASIVHISGELHYFLTFTAALVSEVPGDVECRVYDLNIRDGSWHLWDINNYLAIDGSFPATIGFSCPIVQTKDSGGIVLVNGVPQTLAYVLFENILFGGYTTYGTPTVFGPAGVLNQLVPFDYDISSSLITAYNSPIYPPLYVPQTTVRFRGEVVSPGHKQTMRRLRIQADNAPLPTVQAGAQQQAQVSMAGPTIDPQSNVGVTSKSPLLPMAGNKPATGLPIVTYYSDGVLTDEMVQASISSPVLDSANPWKSLAMFRIANVDIIGVDPRGTTQ